MYTYHLNRTSYNFATVFTVTVKKDGDMVMCTTRTKLSDAIKYFQTLQA